MLWRFGFFWKGLLEGDEGWSGVRFNIALVMIVGIAFLAAFVHSIMYPDLPAWMLSIQGLETSGIPLWLLRFMGNLFHWKSLRFIVIPMIPITMALMVGGQFVQDIYELKSFRLALRYLLACLFGWDYPRLTIRDGRQVLKDDELNLLVKIGGPGYVFITPGSAVLCESLTKPSSVLGQGNYFITRFESLKEIVDLADQHGYIDQIKAITKDGIEVTIKDVHFHYRVWGGRRQGGVTGRSPEHPFPFSPSSIRNIVYNRSMKKGEVTSWAKTVQGKFSGEIQRYIRVRQLNEIITEGEGVNRARDEIKRTLVSPDLRKSMREIGCELLWFDIGNFSYEEPIEETWISTWAADWEGKADVERVRGDSQRDAIIERARSEAQAEILHAMLAELSATRLDGALENNEAMTRLFLLKAGEALEGMSGGRKDS